MASFEVRDNKLFVKDVQINVSGEDSDGEYRYKRAGVYAEIFPEDEPVKVDWLTGLLVIPHGELVNYVHMD